MKINLKHWIINMAVKRIMGEKGDPERRALCFGLFSLDQLPIFEEVKKMRN